MALWNKTSAAPRPPAVPAAEQYLRGFTETSEIAGFVSGKARLSDVLNQRDPIRVERAHVVRLDAIGTEASTEQTVDVDPFDFELILAGPIDPSSAEDHLQRRIRKLTFPVRVLAGRWTVDGLMHLLPGSPPEAVMMRGGLFVPLTMLEVRLGDRLVAAGNFEVALVNRHSIDQILQTTGHSLA